MKWLLNGRSWLACVTNRFPILQYLKTFVKIRKNNFKHSENNTNQCILLPGQDILFVVLISECRSGNTSFVCLCEISTSQLFYLRSLCFAKCMLMLGLSFLLSHSKECKHPRMDICASKYRVDWCLEMRPGSSQHSSGGISIPHRKNNCRIMKESQNNWRELRKLKKTQHFCIHR